MDLYHFVGCVLGDFWITARTSPLAWAFPGSAFASYLVTGFLGDAGFHLFRSSSGTGFGFDLPRKTDHLIYQINRTFGHGLSILPDAARHRYESGWLPLSAGVRRGCDDQFYAD